MAMAAEGSGVRPRGLQSSNANENQPSRQSASSSGSAPSAREVHALLGQFDTAINQMLDYPAKDIINSLTMQAERTAFAPQIVQFLETKIYRVVPQYKLPIFYLTDSILKNVRGPYPALFGRSIVPLYCNCVKQVSAKDLQRFVHVLNTWESTRLFAPEAVAQMRQAANRAQAAIADPARAAAAEPVSFAAQPPPVAAAPVASVRRAPPPQDMELRSLLTQLQNDMGIHPTEHMSLEEVRTNNPDYYNELLAFQAAAANGGAPVEPQRRAPGPALLPPPAQNEPRRDPRRGSNARGNDRRGPAARQPPQAPMASQQPPPRSRMNSNAPPNRHPKANGSHGPAPVSNSGDSSGNGAKSANVAHLMQLLKRKQQAPTGIMDSQGQMQPEITNDPPRAPDPAAVMSILQKLKGLTQSEPSPTPQSQVPSHMSDNSMQQNQLQQQQQPPASFSDSASASKMWFSDTVVSHKERVESNVQKIYAALPLVCRESGLRFKDQSKLNAHLDFLFQFNRAQKERGKGGISRSWYPTEDQWVADFSTENAPRESTSSSFFDRKEAEREETKDAWEWENASVPVDDSITRCRICGENFAKSWDEDEEEWMYTNAVIGTVHNTTPGEPDQETIFHKYCYETVMTNSKHITEEHLIPGSPQSIKSAAAVKSEHSEHSSGSGTAVKRAMEAEDSDSDEDDIKRVKTE